MPSENGADLTAAEKQAVVTEAYREWQEAPPKPLGDGKPAPKTVAYNQLVNVCHQLGMANPADDEKALEQVRSTLTLQTAIDRLRRQATSRTAST